MTLGCFMNRLAIGPNTDSFTDTAPRTIANGLYHWDEFRTAFLAAWTTAGKRMGISSAGFITLDNNGGANFGISWPTDTALRDLMGFTGDLAGANSYTAPRQFHGSWHPQKIINAAIAKPRFAHSTQNGCLSGKRRGFYSGSKYQRARFLVQFVDGVTELASPAGCVVTGGNTTYVGTGETDYLHAMDHWWDPAVAEQGWGGTGRPVRYFADRLDSAIDQTDAAGFTYATADYTTWNFDQKYLEDWAEVAKEFRYPRTVHYTIEWDAQEEV